MPVSPARHEDGLCKVPVKNYSGALFWVEDREKILRDRHFNSRRKEWIINFINTRLSLPSAFRRKILWLSDLGGLAPTSRSDAWEILCDLGYFGKAVKEDLWICQVSADSLHKPTWVDAGFTFFWYAGHRGTNHGQTRSLRDGKPRFKEWVVKREKVKVEDVEVLSMNDASATPIINITDLPLNYLNNCANEVIVRRGSASNGAY